MIIYPVARTHAHWWGGQVKTQCLHSAWKFSLTGVNVPSIVHCNVKNKSGKKSKINQKQATARTAERVSILSIHSTVKLCRKGILQTKREAFFKKMCFQIFSERGERWRAADVCRKRTLNTPIKRKSSSSNGMKRIAQSNQNSSRRRNTNKLLFIMKTHPW